MKIFLFFAILKLASGATTCKPDDDTVTPNPDKCLHPAIAKNIDLKWLSESNAKGWYQEVGNKAARLHLAEILKGELLPEDTDYTKMCSRAQYKAFAKGYNNGTMDGFGGLTGHWECKGIEAEPGALDCQFFSDLTKYEDSLKFYATFSDNKNFYVVVVCFPNGEVGWFTHSINFPFTAEEKETIKKHVKEIGFNDEEIVELYGATCAS